MSNLRKIKAPAIVGLMVLQVLIVGIAMPVAAAVDTGFDTMDQMTWGNTITNAGDGFDHHGYWHRAYRDTISDEIANPGHYSNPGVNGDESYLIDQQGVGGAFNTNCYLATWASDECTFVNSAGWMPVTSGGSCVLNGSACTESNNGQTVHNVMDHYSAGADSGYVASERSYLLNALGIYEYIGQDGGFPIAVPLQKIPTPEYDSKPDDTSITIKWTSLTQSPFVIDSAAQIEGYKVYMATSDIAQGADCWFDKATGTSGACASGFDAAQEFVGFAPHTGDSALHTETIGGLTAGTTYYFRLAVMWEGCIGATCDMGTYTESMWKSASVEISAGSGNTLPTITTTDVTSADEDTDYSVGYEATDMESSTFIWNLSTNASFLGIDTNGWLNSSVTLDNTHIGSYYVDVSADDGDGGNDSHNFTLTINNVAPGIITADDTTAPEDASYSVDYNSDQDGEGTITWHLYPTGSWFGIDNSTGVLSGTLDNSHVGDHDVKVWVTDGNGGAGTTEFTITVSNVNPTITTTTPPTPATEDTYYTYDFDSDQDGDGTITWSFGAGDTSSSWMQIGSTNGTIWGTPDNSHVQAWTVEVEVDDGNSGTDTYSYGLTVTNVAPIITTTSPSATVDEDDTYIYDFNSTDDGFGTITWNLEGNVTAWLGINPATGVVTGTPDNADVGVYEAWVNVTDGNSGSDSHYFAVIVNNVVPTITASNDPNAYEEREYSNDYDSSDESVGGTTYTLQTNASWLGLDPNTGILSGTPTDAVTSWYWVWVNVSDGNGGTNTSGNFTITVNPINDYPVIDQPPPPPDEFVDEDSLYSTRFNSTDEENASRAWHIGTAPAFLSFTDPVLGWLNGTPDNSHVGVPYNVHVYVTEDAAPAMRVWYNYTITVNNTEPSITTANVTEIDEGATYSVDYDSTDDGQGTITWYVTTNASWLSIDSAMGVLSGSPLNRDVGWYDVSVWVDDGNGGVDYDNLTLTVINIPPVITTPDVISSPPGSAYSNDYNVTDDEPAGGVDILAISSGLTPDIVSIFPYNGIGWNSATEVSVGDLSGSANQEAVHSVKVGDVDHDGKNEVVIANMLTDTLSILRWNGVAWTVENIPVDENVFSVFIGDANNDGWADISMVNFNASNPTYVRVINWTGLEWEVLKHIDIGSGRYSSNIFVGDADNDGDNDILVSNSAWAFWTVSFLKWTGSDWTLEAEIGGYGHRKWDVHIADVDGDGNNDIITADLNHNIYIYNWTGSGWSTPINFGVSFARSVFVGDADNDGDDDIIVGRSSGSAISLFRWHGTGWDVDSPIADGGLNVPISVVISDVDMDGENEVVSANMASSEVRASRWNGASWDNVFAESTQTRPVSVAVGDANNDYGYLNTWSLETNASFLSIDNRTGLLYNTTPITGAEQGWYWVNVSVDDGNGAVAWRNFILSITNPPVITTGDVTTATEDTPYSVDYDGNDPDSDPIVWSVETNASFLIIDPVTGVLSGTPDNSDVGSWWVKVILTDAFGAFDSSNFTLTVSNVAPSILTADVTAATEDTPYSVDYNTDQDGEGTITWHLYTNATWLTFDNSTGVLSETPDNTEVGSYFVEVWVTDGNGGSDSTDFTLTVANSPPAILTADVTAVNRDEAYSVNYNSNDDGQGTITWHFYSPTASWLTIDNGTGVLSGNPTGAHVGDHDAKVWVTDGNGGSDSTEFTLTVNGDPAITTADVPIAVVDQAYSTDYEATDPNAVDTQAWTLETNAGFLSIDPVTGILSGNPTAPDLGSYWVNVNVTDSGGLFDWTNFTLTVGLPTTVDLASPLTNPDDAEIDVAVDINITARFTRGLDGSTIGSTTVRLYDESWAEVASLKAGYNPATQEVFFVPAVALTIDSNYTFNISGAVEDVYGYTADGDGDGAAGGNYSITFTTQNQLTYNFDWIVSTEVILTNIIIQMRGNITITETGRLILQGATLKMDSTATNHLWIQVNGSGHLNLSSSSVITRGPSNEWYDLYYMDGSAGNIMDSAISYVGDATSTYPGLNIEAASFYAEGSTFSNNYVGIRALASFTMLDCAFAGNTLADVSVGNDSRMFLLNTTFDVAKVVLEDVTSSIYGQNTNDATTLWGDILINPITVVETNLVMGWAAGFEGNLTIGNGGSLTLSGTTLSISSAFDGEHFIDVLAGGWFNVTDGSTVTAVDTDYEYDWWYQAGSHGRITDSTVEECGWDANLGSTGLRILADDVIIDGSTFQNNRNGVRVRDSSPTIINSQFTANENGILIELGGSNPTVDNNDIQSNGIRGVMLVSTSATLSNLTVITAGQAGINLVGPGTPTIKDSVIQDTDGIRIDQIDAILINVTITNLVTVKDIWIANGASVHLRDCHFDDMISLTSTVFLLTDMQVSGVWDLSDSTLDSEANLTIANLGTLLLDTSTLRMNNTADGEHNITVEAGGTMDVIDGSTVTAADTDFEYAWWYKAGSFGQIVDSTVEEVGYDGTGSYLDQALCIDTANFVIEFSLFQNNYMGVDTAGSNMVIANSTFEDNFYGLGVYSTSAYVFNNVIQNNGQHPDYPGTAETQFWVSNWTDDGPGVMIVENTIQNPVDPTTTTGIDIDVNATLIDNVITGNYMGISIQNDTGLYHMVVNLTGNTIAENSIHGVMIRENSYVELYQNLIRNNGIAGIAACLSVIMSNSNTIKDNWVGIVITDQSQYDSTNDYFNSTTAEANSIFNLFTDMDVRGVWSFTDSTFNSRASITILAGSELLLDTSTLTMVNTADGEHFIDVLSGGWFNVTDGSTVTAADTAFEYDWWYRAGSHGRILDSTIEEIGYNGGGSSGIYIASNDVTVERNTISNSWYGVYGFSAALWVTNNTFDQIGSVGILMDGGGGFIHNNAIIAPYGIDANGATFTASDNDIEATVMGIFVKSGSDAALYNNEVFKTVGILTGGISFIGCSAGYARDNYLHDLNRGIEVGQSTGIVLEDNIFEDNGEGLGVSFFLTPSHVDLINGEFTNNGAAISGWAGSTINWNITTTLTVTNSPIDFYGTLLVKNGGDLTLTGSDLTLYSDLTILSGGPLTMIDSSLDVTGDVVVDAGGVFTYQDSTSTLTTTTGQVDISGIAVFDDAAVASDIRVRNGGMATFQDEIIVTGDLTVDNGGEASFLDYMTGMTMTGDINAWGYVLLNNTMLTLTGDVDVNGRVDVDGAILALASSFDGEFGIEVLSGGEMRVTNSSNVTAYNWDHAITFQVFAGSTLALTDSEVHGVGYNAGTTVEGLYVETSNAMIQHNIFTNNYVGLTLEDTALEVSNNTFDSNGRGIHLHSNMGNTIRDNSIFNSTWGISRDGQTRGGVPLNILNNNISWNGLGIFLGVDDMTTIAGNQFYQNTDSAIYIAGSQNGDYVIDSNVISSNGYSGIRLGNCVASVTISDNEITSNLIGIEMTSSTPNKILTDNTISRNTYGLVLYYSSPTISSGNIISENDWGLSLGSYSNPTISDTIILDNIQVGIEIYSGSAPVLNNVAITNNPVGIYAEDTDFSFIGGNISGSTTAAFQAANMPNPLVIRDSSFYQNDVVLMLDSCDAIVYDSFFIDTTSFELNIGNDAHVTLVNTTYTPGFEGPLTDTSTLTVKWYLNIEVVNAAYLPIYNAHVTVTDGKSAVVYDGYTDAQGLVETLEVTEYVMGSAPPKDDGMNPYTIDATDGGLTNGKSLDIAGGQKIFFEQILLNGAPVLVQTLPDREFDEDTTLSIAFDLDAYFVDVDALTFGYSGNTNIAVTLNADGTVDFAAPADWFGMETITFTATDSFGLFTQTNIDVTVLPVNDAPAISGLVNENVDEDLDLDLDVTTNITDIDNTMGELTISTDSMYASVVGKVITLNYPNGITTEDVTVTVSDGALTASQTITITINPINDAPTIAGVPGQTAIEDEILTLDVLPYIGDVDNATGDLIITTNSAYNVTVNETNVTFHYENGVTFDPVRITVSDGLLENFIDIGIIILPVNDVPTISGVLDQVADEDIEKALDVSGDIDDVDNTPAELTIFEDSDYATVIGKVIRFNYPNSMAGQTEDVTITVSDGALFASQTITVTITAVNDAPTISGVPSFTAYEDVPASLDISPYIGDIDNDMVDLTITTNSAYATVTGKVVTFTYTEGITSESVRITVSDGPLTSYQDIAITVVPVNDGPTIAGVPNAAGFENQDIVLDVSFPYITDIDTDASALTIETNSKYVKEIDQAAHTITFNYPDSAFTGYHPEVFNDTIWVRVSDGSLSAVQANIVISVQSVNDPPIIDGIPDQTAIEDTTFKLNVDNYVSDLDTLGTSLTISTDSKYVVSINQAEHIISLRYDNWIDAEIIQINVSDGQSVVNQSGIIITVSHLNDAPEFKTSAPTLVMATEDTVYALNMTPYITDIDTATGALMIYADSPYASVSGQYVNFLYPNDAPTSENVKITVSDGGLSASYYITVNVNFVNDPPFIAAIPSQTAIEDTQFGLNLEPFLSDPDTAMANLILSTDSQYLVSIDQVNHIIYFQFPNGVAQEIFQVHLTDGQYARTRTVTIEVLAVDDAPVVASIPDRTAYEGLEMILDIEPYISDIDTPVSQLTVIVESRHATVNGQKVSFKYLNGGPASEIVRIDVSDGEKSTFGSVKISVVYDNDPPVFTSRPVIVAMEGIPYRYEVAAADPDLPVGFHLTYALEQAPAGMTINQATGIIDWTPGGTQVGTHSVKVNVTDGQNFVAQSYSVNVAGINDAPTNARIVTPFQGANYGPTDIIPFSGLAEDPDGDALTFTWKDNGTLISKSRVFNSTLPEGYHTIQLVVEDPNGLISVTEITIRVASDKDDTAEPNDSVRIFGTAMPWYLLPLLIFLIILAVVIVALILTRPKGPRKPDVMEVRNMDRFGHQ